MGEISIMRRAFVPLAAVALIATAGCSNMNNTQQRTLSGGAVGAAGGAVITAVTGGCVWCGAAIGGAVGAGAGYVYDQVKKGNM
jgi:osmotically inducible lipoprotein OsmB